MYADTPLMSTAELQRCEQAARVTAIQPELVRATGATRVEQV
jgi:hypothetical protein